MKFSSIEQMVERSTEERLTDTGKLAMAVFREAILRMSMAGSDDSFTRLANCARGYLNTALAADEKAIASEIAQLKDAREGKAKDDDLAAKLH